MYGFERTKFDLPSPLSLLEIEDRLSVTTTINHLWGSINGLSWYIKLLDRIINKFSLCL